MRTVLKKEGKAWLAVLILLAFINFFLLGPLVHSSGYPLLGSRNGQLPNQVKARSNDTLRMQTHGKKSTLVSSILPQPQLIRLLPLPHTHLLALDASMDSMPMYNSDEVRGRVGGSQPKEEVGGEREDDKSRDRGNREQREDDKSRDRDRDRASTLSSYSKDATKSSDTTKTRIQRAASGGNAKAGEDGMAQGRSESKAAAAEEKSKGEIVSLGSPRMRNNRQGPVARQQRERTARPRRSSINITAHDIERLLQHEVDIVVNRLLLEMLGRISCGGRPIMELRDFEQVVAADAGIVNVVPPVDVLGPTGRRTHGAKPRFNTCAVVGNSGGLLDTELGTTIDAADAVIRFNAAPTRGFETHVGKRTTIRIQNVDHLGWRENNREKMAIFTGRTEKDVRKFVSQRRSYAQRSQYMFNPEWWCHIWDWVKHRGMKPSTGVAGMVLALHICSSVKLFGFSHNATRFHYFNQLPVKVTSHDVYMYHPLIEEAELYQHLAKLGYLSLV